MVCARARLCRGHAVLVGSLGEALPAAWSVWAVIIFGRLVFRTVFEHVGFCPGLVRRFSSELSSKGYLCSEASCVGWFGKTCC